MLRPLQRLAGRAYASHAHVAAYAHAPASADGCHERLLALKAPLTLPPLPTYADAPLEPATIHATAVVHPHARLGAGVEIGPFCVIGPDVELLEHVVVKAHVVIDGRTRIGAHTVIHPFASIGGTPQDKKHVRGLSSLEIGHSCIIREHVTINTGTNDGTTRVGDGCWILASSHIGHDSCVGNGVVLSNAVCLAGHVRIDDFAIVGGQVGIKQFVHIGSLAMIGGQSAVDGDVLPFGLAFGNRAKLTGINLVGLRRRNVPRLEIKRLLQTFRYMYGLSHHNKFAPPLALPHHDCIVARANAARVHFASTTNVDMQRLEAMMAFVESSPDRVRSALCMPA
ncbi:hypothetical protein SPRG_01467 [Saprolegnia parasitica CBS 223.65]|uniref:UDP N-acetylglucosamine O-acyltransferase C-terminal domain-containing protein n=1 Tax=Saprolegnia parasitica (strain CBS 223.65) TaxID=695850 RepID=A0A067D5Q2_SAPPC|nr:hypothetical protein SPRG_01467 [Saprolegnia parasitica CBS 223.65]KDO34332.1 hypothetical protein SPRG_01467 [Saprolegnia parasitica CBS 223.65]|eukprot:XP_012195069.1 hypothetical protein SPRG_01467 [Saprolegnia parasitica CBS 223.65]